MSKLPKGFRRGHTDNLACPHRNVSCCPECAAKHIEIVEVYGQHFWVPDQDERVELQVLMTNILDREKINSLAWQLSHPRVP